MLNLVIFNPTSTQPLLNWNLGNTNEKENKNMKDKCYILNNGDVLRMQVKDDWGDEQERRQHSLLPRLHSSLLTLDVRVQNQAASLHASACVCVCVWSEIWNSHVR